MFSQVRKKVGEERTQYSHTGLAVQVDSGVGRLITLPCLTPRFYVEVVT